MKIQRLKAWIQTLPAGEADTPIIEVQGQDLTPNQILDGLQQNKPYGEAGYQALFGPSAVVLSTDFVVRRIEAKYAQGRLDTIYRLTAGPNKALTPEQRIAHIKALTPEGIQELEAERLYLQHIIRKG